MRAFLLLSLGVLLTGCFGKPPTPAVQPLDEISFARQWQDVESAATDSIHVVNSAVPLEQLQAMQPTAKLRELRLDQTPVTDAEADVIAQMDSLEIVNLPASQLTDAGLAKIAALPNLELLRIGSPKLTDAGIEKVGQSKTILYLHLIDTPITDQALPAIAQMEQLQSFYADGTQLTDDGMSNLVKARPQLHIHFNDLHPAGSQAGHTHDHDHSDGHDHNHDHKH
ncbi:hypothetical protein DTL42_17350 [Bremerella cremea]|uniref:Leucine-rich repeat domain-containing protein n=1 Tax=Bremerella cremea TaxID=1031537 RepID=A0A368KN71_9BACT|nr:hypothetical protein [Bremerella cremea]RCS44688.1 hypothetical protein DTL42_17350 [Bremerella cremea]